MVLACFGLVVDPKTGAWELRRPIPIGLGGLGRGNLVHKVSETVSQPLAGDEVSESASASARSGSDLPEHLQQRLGQRFRADFAPFCGLNPGKSMENRALPA